MACTFSIGEKFDSLVAVTNKIEQFQDEHFVQLWKRDARKISAAKTITKVINENLVYYELKYCCNQGGKKISSRGTGERKVATLQKDCPFALTLRIQIKMEIV